MLMNTDQKTPVTQEELKRRLIEKPNLNVLKAISSDFLKIVSNPIYRSVYCWECDNWLLKSYRTWIFWYKTMQCPCKSKSDLLGTWHDYFRADSNMYLAMLQRYSVDQFREDVIDFEYIVDFVNWDQKPRLYLYWTPGTGKTYASVLVLLFSLLTSQTILYTNTPKLMDDLRPNIQNDTWKERMQRCIDVDVLVLDDIGQEKPSEWVKERLYIIINERYQLGKKTILTSNVSLQKLWEKLQHEAIISRILHLGQVFDFSWDDKRVTCYA